MHFWRFAIYNVIGITLWVGLLLYGSYLFANVPIVKKYYSLILFLIVVISVLSTIVELIREKCFS